MTILDITADSNLQRSDYIRGLKESDSIFLTAELPNASVSPSVQALFMKEAKQDSAFARNIDFDPLSLDFDVEVDKDGQFFAVVTRYNCIISSIKIESLVLYHDAVRFNLSSENKEYFLSCEEADLRLYVDKKGMRLRRIIETFVSMCIFLRDSIARISM